MFTVCELACLVEAQPTEVQGYRGRIEAELLVGHYSDGGRDYARVTAFVLAVHPDAETSIAGYAARLAAAPNDIPAFTGASFARWRSFRLSRTIRGATTTDSTLPDFIGRRAALTESGLLFESVNTRDIVVAPQMIG